MNEHTKSAIILAIILLLGTALIFWKAGFFDKDWRCECEQKENYPRLK